MLLMLLQIGVTGDHVCTHMMSYLDWWERWRVSGHLIREYTELLISLLLGRNSLMVCGAD